MDTSQAWAGLSLTPALQGKQIPLRTFFIWSTEAGQCSCLPAARTHIKAPQRIPAGHAVGIVKRLFLGSCFGDHSHHEAGSVLRGLDWGLPGRTHGHHHLLAWGLSCPGAQLNPPSCRFFSLLAWLSAPWARLWAILVGPPQPSSDRDLGSHISFWRAITSVLAQLMGAAA